MNIYILQEASDELDEAYSYYENLQSGLGDKFISRFKEALELIRYFPLGWHPLSDNFRRTLLKSFPYGIIYTIEDNQIIIVAIANLHQKPKSYINRINI